jgi:tetratricopeptide (TPR) repeat protein
VPIASLFALMLAAETPAPGGAAARVDELWRRRDDPAALAEQKRLLDDSLSKAPADYGLLWRAARWYLWKSDDPDLSNDAKSKLGKEGWALAERAVAANPAGVEGHYWAATTMGSYALGLGIVRAISQGIEGKFRAHLSRASAIDSRYAHGSIPIAWGRYYAVLPWPKYDERKAIQYYRQALEINPNNLRARVFWADLHLEEDRPAEAKRLLDEVLAAPGNRYDPPEEKRAKLLATRAMPKVMQALK